MHERPREVENPKHGKGHLLDDRVDVEIAYAHPLEALPNRAGIDAGEAEVLLDGQIGDQRRVLEHGRHARCQGVRGTTEMGEVPVHLD